jgi:hypothetical protein
MISHDGTTRYVKSDELCIIQENSVDFTFVQYNAE